MFGYKELYVTTSMEEAVKVRQKIEQSGIKYYTKARNTTGGSRSDRRTSFGSLGENTKYQYTYTIYVKRKQLEEAKQYLKK